MPSSQELPASAWPSKTLPAPKTGEVLAQLTDFLEKLGYKKTIKALSKEANDHQVDIDLKGWRSDQGDGPAAQTLGDLYIDRILEGISGEEDTSSSNDSGSEASDDDSDASDSDSESEPAITTESTNLKRKRSVEDESSSDDSSSEESSSEESPASDEAPPRKKAKPARSSSDSSSAEDPSASEASSAASSSEDLSSSEASSSDSSSSDSSSDDSMPPPPPKKKVKTVKATTMTIAQITVPNPSISSQSSATLAGSPQPSEHMQSSTHPARQHLMDVQTQQVKAGALKAGAAPLKKFNEPFSRIPKDTVVDPRFASNAYVSYNYADRAHQDLSVTKGKGFTKEKNKKKRGSYRGGTIDTTPKGIKFED